MRLPWPATTTTSRRGTLTNTYRTFVNTTDDGASCSSHPMPMLSSQYARPKRHCHRDTRAQTTTIAPPSSPRADIHLAPSGSLADPLPSLSCYLAFALSSSSCHLTHPGTCAASPSRHLEILTLSFSCHLSGLAHSGMCTAPRPHIRHCAIERTPVPLCHSPSPPRFAVLPTLACAPSCSSRTVAHPHHHCMSALPPHPHPHPLPPLVPSRPSMYTSLACSLVFSLPLVQFHSP